MRVFALATIVVIASCGGVEQREAAIACAPHKISFQFDNVTPLSQSRFRRNLCRALVQVRDWWGSGYRGPIKVTVEDTRGPSMALIPTWRGNRGDMLFRSRPVDGGRTAKTHEATHLMAPNGNRFLAEGLAVYVQQKFGANRAYPNYGRNLDKAAAPLAGHVPLAEFDRLATPNRLQFPGTLDSKDAYIVAGSFIGYVIDRYGLEKFQKLYAMTPLVPFDRNQGGTPKRWVRIYGKPLQALEREWRAKLAANG